MLRAAGIMIVCGPTGKALFLQRSGVGDMAGTWSFAGGKIEDGETSAEAAIREAREEIGAQPFDNPRPWTRRQKDGVDFETFLARSDVEFVPELSDEHTAWTWAPLDAPPEPLHPGCRVAIDRVAMDELGIARAIADGELVSPQRYKNLFLVALRITGTGAAYRGASKNESGEIVREEEFCWRDPSIYLNDEFLARCNGLPVIWDHPPNRPMLNGEEFVRRTIGTVMLPYIKGEDVWAVAKVYDEEAANALETKQFSTSPGVVFDNADPIEMKDGTRLLIEDKPALLDHIAVCSAGVWDKGGEPSGIQNDLISTEEPIGMAEMEMAEADKARTDMDSKLDAIMDSLKKAHDRMDAMEHGREDRHRKDAADKGETEDRAEREDAKRHDADEEEKHEDEAKKDRKDADCAMDRKDTKGRKDESFEEWAKEETEEPEHKQRKDRARKDENALQREAAKETKMLERDDSRHDALVAENTAMKERLAMLEARMKPVTAEDRDALARAQMRADSIAGLFGQRASPPIPGETPLDYRRRLAGDYKQHSAMFKDKSLANFDADMLGFAEERIYADAATAARSPGRAANGTLIPIRTVDEAGRTITSWTGDNAAWMSLFMTPGRVGKIVDPRNRNVA